MVPKTVYSWDSMDDQNKHNSLTALRDTEHWVVWKTKDNTWTHTLREAPNSSPLTSRMLGEIPHGRTKRITKHYKDHSNSAQAKLWER